MLKKQYLFVIIVLTQTLFTCTTPSNNSNNLQGVFNNNDSLHVLKLLHKGDSTYAIRSNMDNIAQALVFFDSAQNIAEKIPNTKLYSKTLYYIGNIYNAWNNEPEKTIFYYQKAASLLTSFKDATVERFYLYYILAHAYDNEKAKDSARCIKHLYSIADSLSKFSKPLLDSMDFLSDFAWVATNINNYSFAEFFLNKFCTRKNIYNNPATNNYLDHYYLTKARIDILQKRKTYSLYTDSLNTAATNCLNKFDKAYYYSNLENLFKTSGNFSSALGIANIYTNLQNSIHKEAIKGLLEKNKIRIELSEATKINVVSYAKIRTQNLILVLCAIVICFFVVLYFYIISLHKKAILKQEAEIQSTFSKKLIQVTEEEQKRVACDLHDSISNELITLQRMFFKDNNFLKTKIDTIIDEVRIISHNLHPTMFDRVGLASSINHLIEKIQHQHNFMLSADIKYNKTLSTEKELQVYRIIQEAITNILKHANANAGKIILVENAKFIVLEIIDNGLGFNVEAQINSKKSFGLINIIQRSKLLNGNAKISSDKSGTKIIIQIPK